MGKSFFLFGPRGTGKTFWVRSMYPEAIYFDLLDNSLFVDLLSDPTLLEKMIPNGFKEWVIIDEVQKIPKLLNEVHRLIESKGYRFILTGSSARQLRKKGVNLLAGRALHFSMFPLTAIELGEDFSLEAGIQYGGLPSVQYEEDPKHYLESYVKTYLREEILHEGITRNLGAFRRFLEAASFSQGSLLNVSVVARECGIDRKSVIGYFDILEDLMLAQRITPFTKRAKRDMVSHSKFYFFDAGVFLAIRPKGPLDAIEELGGIALETLFYQNLVAINSYKKYGFTIHFWRTKDGDEVDFIAYGPHGIFAFEIKRGKNHSPKDIQGLKKFQKIYPMAKLFLLNNAKRTIEEDGIIILNVEKALLTLPQLLSRE